MTPSERKFVKQMSGYNKNIAKLIAEQYKKDHPTASENEIKKIYRENYALTQIAVISSLNASTKKSFIKTMYLCLKDFGKLLWHWFISVIPGAIIAAIGLYLSSTFHQNWIWNIAGTLALIITAILFTYKTQND